MNATARPPAVLFMGDLVIVARQTRLIAEAHRRGFAPLLVVTPYTDPARLAELRADPEHPLSKLADVVEVEDAKVDFVVPGIQPWLRRYDVQAVLCVGDFFVEPVGVVADCLGVPGAGSAASRISRNKMLQRTALPDFSPAFQVVTPADRTSPIAPDMTFPVVVKPVARFSSLGVRQVHKAEDLPGVLATYPEDETVLVESRVVGPEFSVEALTQNGEVLWSGVTAKRTNESGGIFFTEMGHTSPAELSDADERALVEANAKVLRRLGFRDGISHAEFRLSADGPVMMEIATRLPGDGITFLWELATGEPLEPVMLDLALGEPTAYPAPRRRACQVYLDHPFGPLRDVTSTGAPVSWVTRDDSWPAFTPQAPDAPAKDHAVLVTVVEGEVLGPQTDSEARSASVVFDLPLDEATEPLAKLYADTVTITVDTP
ncbi:ATP-grasp domain-containing protein [Actinokineospora xionganensis]|uniref:ATP-grasp domain-containing protein n=1 Tax=Actinokineospora xionganensis TaxID=2684470 RepID=A0ABR7LF02_9PSEU|nr:ATP-grasp domain-containing protein [Actinokineospora xionganensis]MBC6451073.1 ATP-grasp domain-containing protein [Actinokineospora xionganensis]